MRFITCSYLVFVIFMVGCVLLLQAGCQGQIGVGDESDLAASDSPSSSDLDKDGSTRDVLGGPDVETQEAIPDINQPLPRITFEESVHDFGILSPDMYHNYGFKFTNTGEGILKIGKIKSTCSCTVPKLTKKEYAPGESGIVKVKYHSSKRAGSRKERLYVHSNDKTEPKFKLLVKAKVVLKVTHEPKRLNFSFKQKDVNCPEIILSSVDDQPFAIKQVKSRANSVSIDFDPLVEATRFVLKAKIDIEKMKTIQDGRIDIKITHPECKVVTVPFNVLPEFKISPPKIVTLDAKRGESVERTVWVINNYDKGFEIESISSEKGVIKVLDQESVDGSRYKLKLEITPPEAEKKMRIFKDVLSVKVKDGEELKVTCHGFYSKK